MWFMWFNFFLDFWNSITTKAQSLFLLISVCSFKIFQIIQIQKKFEYHWIQFTKAATVSSISSFCHGDYFLHRPWWLLLCWHCTQFQPLHSTLSSLFLFWPYVMYILASVQASLSAAIYSPSLHFSVPQLSPERVRKLMALRKVLIINQPALAMPTQNFRMRTTQECPLGERRHIVVWEKTK